MRNRKTRKITFVLLLLALLPISTLGRQLVLVLSQEDLKEAAADSTNLVEDPSDSGFDDFIDSEAKPDYVLDPGSWSPIFEPTTAPQVHLEHEGAYYSSVSKIVKAYSRGDERAMEEAASEIEAAASAGQPHAQSILGFLYGMGIGRERSKSKSFLYHHFAAEGGNMQSKMALAYTYSRQEMHDKAVKLYAELAEVAINSFLISKDSPVIEPVRIHTGAEENKEALRKSRGEEDEDFQILEYQAQKGNAGAMYKIGIFYYFGLRGVRRDHTKALSWFLRAVEKGEARSMELLGEIYARGAGVERNFTEALEWLTLASKQQLYSAYNGLGYLYVKGYGVEKNYTKAKEYFEKAADNGEAGGFYNLGVMYLKGIGVKRDVKIASKYFITAFDAGQPKAFYQLAKMFHTGVGLKKNVPLLANPQPESSGRSNLASRQPTSTAGLNTSSSGLRRPSSSGGSRPSTPTGRPTLSATTSLTSSTRRTSTTTSKAMTSTATSKTMSTTTTSRPARSSTPTSRSTLPSAKSTVPTRSSTPTARSSARSLTPTRNSSTLTTRASVPGSKSTSRAATPTRRPTSVSSTASASAPSIKSLSSVAPATTTSRNPGASRPSSPTVKPRPWKPSDIPGLSYDAPPNLRTSLSDRPTSVTRGRPGAPSARSSSIEPVSNGRIRRQSCSPSRGRPPNGVVRSSGSSVPIPAMSRLHAKANDNVSPGMVGTKMVERVVNMRKLAPPAKQDNKHSPRNNLYAHSSSPDSSGFGRTLSKKSLDMAMRHMDIRRSISGNLRPSMTNIPASSMYSVRSGPNRSRTVSVSDSPLATSSNASSEVSVNNNTMCLDGSEADDAISGVKVARSAANMHGR